VSSRSHPPVSASPPPWRSGVDAARANALPGVVLSFFAVGVLLGYWYVEPIHEAFERLGAFKLRSGWWFAVVGTGLFGGVLPWVVDRLRPGGAARATWRRLVFLALLWGWKGFEIDLFYRGLGWLIGDAPSLGVVAAKVLLDMGPWVVLWAVPTTVLAYEWMDAGFSVSGMRGSGAWRGGLRGWYARRVVPVLISNWAVWTPAVCVIYCLPLPMQLPMQNLVLCFWALLMARQVGPAVVSEG